MPSGYGRLAEAVSRVNAVGAIGKLATHPRLCSAAGAHLWLGAGLLLVTLAISLCLWRVARQPETAT
jgi:hypothetical protein